MSATPRRRATIVIPVYCERATLPQLVNEIFRQDGDVELEVWVVDDNSPDGTAAVVEELMQRFDRLHLMSRRRPEGRGAAVIDAFGRLLELPAPPDFIVEMDGDGSHEAASLRPILAAAASAEVVIGSRYVAGGAADLSGKRRLLSRLANGFAATVLGLPYTDCSTGYRCYRREALGAVDLDAVRSGGHATHLELLFRLHRSGVSIAEVPIHYRVRAGGKSKVTLGETLRVAWVLLRMRLAAGKSPPSG